MGYAPIRSAPQPIEEEPQAPAALDQEDDFLQEDCSQEDYVQPGLQPSSEAILAQRAALARVAQGVLDLWVQDADGWDEELGQGGICQDVAEAMASTLSDLGVGDIATLYTDMGGGHVFLVANLADGVFEVDIPASVYETGGGYVWTKRPGVTLEAEDVVLTRLGPLMAPEAFEVAYCDA